jgi:hypothetical protein
MRQAILTLVMAAGLAMAGNAQDVQAAPGTNNRMQADRNASPQDRARHNADRAEKDLGLTADQKAKWEAAVLERATANEPLKKQMDGATTPDQRKQIRQQMKANEDKFETTVSTFLSADQKTKYETIKQQRKDRMHERAKDNRSGN